MTPDEAYLDKAIDRYALDVAAVARTALEKLRLRYAGARLLVHERRQSLHDRPCQPDGGPAVFSVVLYRRRVRFFFLEGAAIDDPERRLEGTGNQGRSIRLERRAAILDEGYPSPDGAGRQAGGCGPEEGSRQYRVQVKAESSELGVSPSNRCGSHGISRCAVSR